MIASGFPSGAGFKNRCNNPRAASKKPATTGILEGKPVGKPALSRLAAARKRHYTFAPQVLAGFPAGPAG
jgi:hypothetical protein